MERFTSRVGVIFQNYGSLPPFYEQVTKDTNITTCLLKKGDSSFYSRIERETAITDDNFYHEVFSFHHVRDFKDAQNLAGILFNRFHFIDGYYPVEILNYLQSRIRSSYVIQNNRK